MTRTLIGKVDNYMPNESACYVAVKVPGLDGPAVSIKPSIPDWYPRDGLAGKVVEVVETTGGYKGWMITKVFAKVAQMRDPDRRVRFSDLEPGRFYLYQPNLNDPDDTDGPFLMQADKQERIKLLRAPGRKPETVRARSQVWLEVDGTDWDGGKNQGIYLEQCIPGRFYVTLQAYLKSGDIRPWLIRKNQDGELRGYKRSYSVDHKGVRLCGNGPWVEVTGDKW